MFTILEYQNTVDFTNFKPVTKVTLVIDQEKVLDHIAQYGKMITASEFFEMLMSETKQKIKP